MCWAAQAPALLPDKPACRAYPAECRMPALLAGYCRQLFHTSSAKTEALKTGQMKSTPLCSIMQRCACFICFILSNCRRAVFSLCWHAPLCCPKGQRTAGIFRFMAHPEREGTVFYESFFNILTAVFRLYRSMNETCKIRFPVKGVLCCDCVFYQRRRAPQLYSASFYLFWQACLRTT